VFAGLLDWLFWNRLPGALFVAGAIVVIASATLALRLKPERLPVSTAA
jgi:drug/metabolite transporter (DMT)-like permease